MIGDYKQPLTQLFSVSLILEGQNISLAPKDIMECYFVEDIFNFCITGKLMFVDLYGIAEYGPLTGNEQIVIEYGDEEDRQIGFDIFRMKSMIQSATTNPTTESIIEIIFIDLGYEFFKRKFSRSWTDEKASDIVKWMLANWVGDPEIGRWEDSSETIDFIIPFWSVMSAIQYLAKRNTGVDSNMPGFLYYHSTEEVPFRANWITFDQLFVETTDYIDSEIYEFEKPDDVLYKNLIYDWWLEGIDKYRLKKLKGGHKFGYNIQGKQLIDRSYEYSSSISKVTMMGRASLFKDISDKRIYYETTSETTSAGIDNRFYNEFLNIYNTQQALNIVVRGSEFRYAGQQIEINWPSVEAVNVPNKQRKGKYLIKSITNMFAGSATNLGWVQRLVLLKNAYESSDNRDLVKATKMNVAS